MFCSFYNLRGFLSRQNNSEKSRSAEGIPNFSNKSSLIITNSRFESNFCICLVMVTLTAMKRQRYGKVYPREETSSHGFRQQSMKIPSADLWTTPYSYRRNDPGGSEGKYVVYVGIPFLCSSFRYWYRLSLLLCSLL